MSKLNELDEELEYKLEHSETCKATKFDNTVGGEISEDCYCQIKDFKSFARKYYLLGKLEEREALKNAVIKMFGEYGTMNIPHGTARNLIVDYLNELK